MALRLLITDVVWSTLEPLLRESKHAAETLRAFSYRRKDGMKALFTPLRPRPLSRNHDTTGASVARTTRRLSPGSPDRQHAAPERREVPIRAVDHIIGRHEKNRANLAWDRHAYQAQKVT